MKNFLKDFEIKFLYNNGPLLELEFCQIDFVCEKHKEYISSCMSKEHFKVLTEPLSSEIIFGKDLKLILNTETYEIFEKVIITNIEKHFLESSVEEKFLTLLSLAVSCLQIFVRSNWTSFKQPTQQIFFYNETLDSWLMKEICIDGEFINPLSKNIFLLILSKLIFTFLSQNSDSMFKTINFWLMRTIWIFQQLVKERSPTFKQQILGLLTLIKEDLICFNDDDASNIKLQFFLESVHIFYFYYEPNLAQEALQSAINISKLTIELSGIMGKRTKFQSKDLSQLFLKVKNYSNQVSLDQYTYLPKNISLEDESLLNKMQPCEEINQHQIDSNMQALILAMCYYHQRNCEGHSNIIKEEIMAYINFLLEQPTNYFVQTMSLFLRSRWQNEGFRYIHRSILQLEELINYQNTVKFEDNFDYKFCVNLPPFWNIQLELGILLESLGSIDGALEVYEKLNMYENIIKCHLLLSNKNKAECIIRERLLKHETAELYCYLGDVTQNEEYYLKSWQISNGRYSKAQRSLAYLYLHNKKYDESLQFFEKSLEINSLQISTWFSYGCASLSSCDYSKAATAFRRCVNLDSDNFEAWNNLATSYIKSGNKKRAFLTLQEAIKYSFDNWRLWENYLLVCIDTGHFEEGIQSYHRILDLKEKHIDVQVLEIMVTAILGDIVDANGNLCKLLLPKILILFGRITSKTLNNAEVWRLYSQLICQNKDGDSKVNEEKMLQYLQKSHCCLLSDRNWATNVDKCFLVIERTITLAKIYEDQINKVESLEMKKKLITSSKLLINNFIIQIKKFHLDFISGMLKEPIANSVLQLEAFIQRFNSVQIDL